MRRINDEGATFRSHIDGSLHMLTPERAVDIQAQLGSDIAMVLDECIGTLPGPDPTAAQGSDRKDGSVRAAMERSVRWAERGRRRFIQLRDDPRSSPEVIVTNPGQAQFGIIQGGTELELRSESVQRTVDIGFDAYAIGGL